MGLTLALALLLLVAHTPYHAAQGPAATPLHRARQLLVVRTDDWNAASGTAERFERPGPAAPWRAVGGPFPVAVGRKGLAWGRGVAGEPSAEGPVKREGDDKAPAGVFTLSPAFGRSKTKPQEWRLPYRSLEGNVECVDDVRSDSYNRLVTRQEVAKVDWASSEKMWTEPEYRWGVVVQHNSVPVERGAGSCIFLHVWSAPRRGTAGCTAMEETSLTETIRWLDPARHPLLVQLPRSEYARLAAAWGLPGVE